MERTGMIVPTEMLRCIIRCRRIHVDHSDARLSKASRTQTTLTQPLPSVPITQLGILPAEVEGIGHSASSQDTESGGAELVGRFAFAVERAAKAIELMQQLPSVVEPLVINAGRQGQVLRRKTGFRRIA